MRHKRLSVAAPFFPWIAECIPNEKKPNRVENVHLICAQAARQFKIWAEFDQLRHGFFYGDAAQIDIKLLGERNMRVFRQLGWEAQSAGYRLLLRCIRNANPGIRSAQQLEKWCACLYLSFSHLKWAKPKQKIIHNKIELDDIRLVEEISWICETVGKNPRDVSCLKAWKTRMSGLTARSRSQVDPWEQVHLTWVIQRTWAFMRGLPYHSELLCNWPPEPRLFPDAFAARQAIDLVVNWCAEQKQRSPTAYSHHPEGDLHHDDDSYEPEVVIRPNDRRNKIIYEKMCGAMKYQAIRNHLIIMGFSKDDLPSSIQGIREAGLSYARKHGKPLPPPRRDERVK